MSYDGDGQLLYVEGSSQLNEDPPVEGGTYRIRSTALGGEIVYENSMTYIHAGGDRIAMQNSNGVMWNHHDPNMKSFRSTAPNGTVLGEGYWGVDYDKIETDPDGKSVGFSNPVYYPPDSNDLFAPNSSFGSMVNGQYTTFVVDGISVPQDYLWSRIETRHGSLGLDLLEFSVTQAWRIREWRFVGVDGYYHTFAPGQVPQHAVDMLNRGFANAYAILDNSWSAINLISGQTQQQTFVRRRATTDEAKVLKASVTSAANNSSKCRTYIKDLIEKVAANAGLKPEQIVSTSIEELFDTVFASRRQSDGLRGGIFIQDARFSHSASNLWTWVGEPGFVEINLGFGNSNSTIESFLSSARYGGIKSIHELMHVAIRGTALQTDDEAFARAAADIAGVARPVWAPFDKNKPVSASNEPINYQASRYWGERLNQACGFPSHITGKMTSHKLYK